MYLGCGRYEGVFRKWEIRGVYLGSGRYEGCI